ncbi:MAG TPA: phosphate ABC transporter permease subunit PstC [Gemmataceae bacterium]|nr:phosphate ABC transporter permease subunit PstC [Gemmataceae bacterium]
MTQEQPTISRPPTSSELILDRSFRALARGLASLIVVVMVLLVCLIAIQASPAIRGYGLSFVSGTTWNAGKEQFGILPEIWGTLYSSLLGVALGSLFGVAVAIFLTEDFIPPWLQDLFKHIVNLLAAIPSVVYGLWGIFVVIPTIRPPCNWLHDHLGWIPIFGTPLLSVGMLPAAAVLAIMVLPTVSAISRDALASVNPRLREAAYGLGATRWEAIRTVIVPTASRGIYGSIILGFGRALGETMALAMLVGSTSTISWSLFSPGNTLAALLANRFPEAASPMELGVLMYAALVLLALTLIVNVLGELILMRGTAAAAPAR